MFSKEKIKKRLVELANLRYGDSLPIPTIYAQRLEGGKTEGFTLSEGQRWGEYDTIYQLNFNLEIPASWRNLVVALHLNLTTGPSFGINTVEGLVSIDGHPFHALDRYHREIILTSQQVEKGKLAVSIKLWSGINEKYHTVEKMELRCIDQPTHQLYTQMSLILTALENLSEQSPSYYSLAAALEESCAALDFRKTDKNSFYQSVGKALEILNSRVAQINQQFASLSPDKSWQPHVTGIGHAHIDVAWLWRLSHTRLKAADTFSTALYHMERYPHFVFIQSQPQLYQFVKEDQPELFNRIKEKVAAGQWEAEGAMWVESDTNIPNGESLVRQFLFGQRFFQREFGYTCKVLWLPDVFGYSPALPQLIKGAEAEYFITSKLSWNDTNRMPADTFWWQGMDGSKVLTYFLTAQNDDSWHAYTYNGDMHPGVLARAWKNYAQKEINRETLVAYGWGDGGGGPTRPMIEAAALLGKPLSPELPTASTGRVADFMDRVKERVTDNSATPEWNGELYFEYHRGTYTSQARTKRNNRLTERNLHNAEWLSSAAAIVSGQPYPQKELNQVWEKVLTNQFHDIIPGSSIGEVYQDAEETYAEIRAVTDEIITQAQETLSQHLNLGPDSLVIFNGLPWERDALVEIEAGAAQYSGYQIQDLGNGRSLVEFRDVPAYGYQIFPIKPQSSQKTSQVNILKATTEYLENSYYRLEFNQKGQISRLFDKTAGREVLVAGARGNVFQLFEDKPLDYDAWDINDFYKQKSWELDELVSIEPIEQGPLRAGVQLEWLYNGRTRITQKIYLYRNNPRIDFVTQVDWQERQTLLKVAFPVDVHSPKATAEVQFGNIERTTHRNTSWDAAKFETCAHKWFDLSEGGYGVAILNDCKYGYDVLGNVMRQTLLKGAIYPDPQADLGLHEFTYSLLPHSFGGWFGGRVHRAAYELNHPLLVFSGGEANQHPKLPTRWSLVEVESHHNSVIVETVKKAEDNDGLIIRVYECANMRGKFSLKFPYPIARAVEVNLLEHDLADNMVEIANNTLTSYIRPYQIKTFRVSLTRNP